MIGDLAALEMLFRIIGQGTGGSYPVIPGDTCVLKLYKGGPPITKADSKGGIIESDGTGYSPKVLSPGNWGIYMYRVGTGDTNMAAYATQTFTYTGADSIAGYYITTVKQRGETGDSILMWREAFNDGPYVIPAGGGMIKVDPKIILG